MKVKGACHCGNVTYDAEVNPDHVVICHCTDCQTISGGPYRVNVPVSVEKIELAGQVKEYMKTGDSGNEVVTVFCGDCGAAMYSCKRESPSVLFLRVGAIKQRAELRPKMQGFCRSAMPWAMDITGIRRIAE